MVILIGLPSFVASVMLSMMLWCLLADMKDLAWLAVPSSLSGVPMTVCSSFWKLLALAHPSEVDFATRFLVLVFMICSFCLELESKSGAWLWLL